MNPIGADEAAAIREQAAALAAYDDITKTSRPGEIFLDLSCALESLAKPVKALLADAFGDHNPELAAELADVADVLLAAAGGLRLASHNV